MIWDSFEETALLSFIRTMELFRKTTLKYGFKAGKEKQASWVQVNLFLSIYERLYSIISQMGSWWT